MRRERSRATGLEATARAFSSWRRRFGGPGRRIPDELWAEAGEAARSNGVAETARALHLDTKKLAAVAKGTLATEKLAPLAFVEFGEVDIGARHESMRIELVGRDGEQARVHVPSGVHIADVVEVCRAFWSRSS